MRYLYALVILLIFIHPGCKPPIEVPDLRESSDGPGPIFLVDTPGNLEVIDSDGVPVDGEEVRIDNCKIADTVVRSIASRSTGSFTWRGDIPENARLSAHLGIGEAPIYLFSVMGIIPPINRYGPQTGEPPEGVLFTLLANGQKVFDVELPRDAATWTPININLAPYAGDDVELTFMVEGIVVGTKLPYWGHPEILISRETPRRVILLGIDTLAGGHCGWMGYDRDTTPNLDRLSRRSTIFMDAHSPSPWTLPSFAAVMSGRLPGVTGADRRNRGLSDNEDMLAEIFARNNFATCGIVNIPHLQEAGFFQGMDYQWEVHDHPAVEGLTQARNWIEYHFDQDFFMFLHLFDPHIPYTPPEGWADEFRDPDYDGEYGLNWDLPGGLVTQNHTDPGVWADFSEEDRIQCENLYDADIAGMDEALGEFFDWYEQEGMLEDTLLIVFSDHGEEFGEHGRWEHGHSQYEEQLHVPLFIKLPEQTASRTVNGLVGTVDIYPTILELFGFESGNDYAGQSLLPVLNGGVPDPDRWVISESTLWGPEIKSITTDTHKYILTIPTGAEELYDLVRDPGETEDISVEEPEVLAELGAIMEQYVSETQSGWHLRLLAGPELPLTVDLTISSTGAIADAELVGQIFNGTGDLRVENPGTINVNLVLAPLDTVEIRFKTNPETSPVTFSGTVGETSAMSGIRLGASGMDLVSLYELYSDEQPSPEGDDLDLTIDDPVIAFSFPDYTREDSRGAYLWSVPESLRAHAASLSPEQLEALESVGYFFE